MVLECQAQDRKAAVVGPGSASAGGDFDGSRKYFSISLLFQTIPKRLNCKEFSFPLSFCGPLICK